MGHLNHLRLPLMDEPVSVFAICQAHLQLEHDYNHGGWLRERPSNRRRSEATHVQLWRMKYSPGSWWVDILATDEGPEADDEAVRDIYLINVLKLGLPIDDEMRAFMANRYVPEFLESFPSWSQQ